MAPEPLLPPESLARYADAIVRASLWVEEGDTLVVQGEPEHRELLVAVAEAAYRTGARFVDVVTADPLVLRARLLHGSDEAIGALSPWARRRLREVVGPRGALAVITGDGESGYLDGVPPERIATDYARLAKRTAFVRHAQLNMRARWTIAGWPTDHWAGQVYPELAALEAKRRLAGDLLRFCRLADGDGKGASGWLAHLRGSASRGWSSAARARSCSSASSPARAGWEGPNASSTAACWRRTCRRKRCSRAPIRARRAARSAVRSPSPSAAA